MKKLVLALAALATLLVGTTLIATPAEAATNPSCITKTEFRKVTKGMSITRVKAIVGSTGSQTYYDGGYPGSYGWPAEQWRDHKQCNSRWGLGSAEIDYKKQAGVWRVSSKHAFWF